MTATVTTHLDPAMIVSVTALLESSMTMPVNTMMTVVTMGNPHHSDTATMTVMTVDHRLNVTVTHLDSSTTTTVKVSTTVVTVKDPAQGMTVRIVPHLDPILLDTTMTVTVTALLESSMTMPVDKMMTVVTVGHPHRSVTMTRTAKVREAADHLTVPSPETRPR
jgi:hypothetical protein